MTQSLDLIDKKQLFIDYLLAGNGVPKSAKLAGIEVKHASRYAKQCLLDPRVRHYARQYLRGQIDMEGAPEGYRVLVELLRDDLTPRALKVDIAKFLVNHSVPAPKAAEESVDDEKDIAEMSDAELQAAIRQTDQELERRGILINATPAQSIDNII